MDDLIKALEIFLKYGNPDAPTHCDHDVMINPKEVSNNDLDALGKLSFEPDYDDKTFKSGGC